MKMLSSIHNDHVGRTSSFAYVMIRSCFRHMISAQVVLIIFQSINNDKELFLIHHLPSSIYLLPIIIYHNTMKMNTAYLNNKRVSDWQIILYVRTLYQYVSIRVLSSR